MFPAGWHRLDYIPCYHGDYATYRGLTFQLKHPYNGQQKSGTIIRISNTWYDNMHDMSTYKRVLLYIQLTSAIEHVSKFGMNG